MSALKLTDPRYRKWQVAVVGVAGEALLVLQDLAGSGLVHGRALAGVQAAVGLLVALGVRKTPNAGAGPTGTPGVPR